MKKGLHLGLFLFTILVMSTASIGFSEINNDIEKLKKKAINEFDSERYHNAKEIISEVIKHDPDDAVLHYNMGISCLHTSSFNKAIKHLEKAYELDPENGIDKRFPYWLGKAYHQNHQFEAALGYYYMYDESIGKNHIDKKEVELLMKQVMNGAELMDNPSNRLLVKMDGKVNSVFDDHSPILTANGSTVYYTSKIGLEDRIEQDFNGDYFEKVFAVQKNHLGIWSDPKLVTDSRSNLHQSCIQVFAKEEKMLVYTSEGRGSLHVVQKNVAGKWVVQDELTEINEFHPNGNATISEDGNILVFSKYVDKRDENADLFMSVKTESGTWGHPVPLTGSINTQANETAPFLSPDGKTFYFASDGERSIGGYDIFKVEHLGGNNWSEPKNLGYPLNSAYHDLYYQENEDKTIAAFSSHREGGNGQLDIYLAYDVQMIKVTGNVGIEEGLNPEDIAVYFNSVGEGQHPFSAKAVVREDGTFEKELVSDNAYKVFVTHSGEVIKEEVIKLDKAVEKGEEMNYAIVLKNNNIQMMWLEIREDVIISKHATQEAQLKDYSKANLESILAQLEENEKLKITLIGNIGDVDSGEYDLEQSKQEAHNVASYFLKNGISHERIRVTGGDETYPIETNLIEDRDSEY